MEIIGIICEYNPFHNGHLYHLNKIKEMYKNSLIILVMSGYFTERGDISLISKYHKTELALRYGVDIVLELPTLYTLHSSDYFGEYALKLLWYIGVTKIVFGSEINDIDILVNIAKKQFANGFDKKVQEHLKRGLNYPTSLAKSCNINLLSNDILALAYIKAIIKNNYTIEPISIKRTSDYNDTTSNENIVSASNIRNKINNGEDITKYIPDYNQCIINRVNEDKLFFLLKYKIITSNNLYDYLGVDEGLGYKLKSVIYKTNSLEELIMSIKSKRYTYVRLKRMLMHILLGIRKEDVNTKLDSIRVLGFTKEGQEYLHKCKLPNLVNRISDIERRSMEIYYMLTQDKSVFEDIKNKPIIKD